MIDPSVGESRWGSCRCKSHVWPHPGPFSSADQTGRGQRSVLEVTAARLEVIAQDAILVVPPHGGPAALAGLLQALATVAGTANRPAAVRARVIAMEVDCLHGLTGLEVGVTPAENGHVVALDIISD